MTSWLFTHFKLLFVRSINNILLCDRAFYCTIKSLSRLFDYLWCIFARTKIILPHMANRSPIPQIEFPFMTLINFVRFKYENQFISIYNKLEIKHFVNIVAKKTNFPLCDINLYTFKVRPNLDIEWPSLYWCSNKFIHNNWLNININGFL